MPKQTFFNLPEEKRELITTLAIEEFAEYDYDLASISRIVSRAHIAKGSFYQYFEDKRDLYFYLLDLANKEKMGLLRNQTPPDPDMGFFDTIRWLFSVNLRFQLARPRLNQVAYRSVFGNNPHRQEALASMRERSTAYFTELLQKGVARGDLDPQIDPGLAAFVLGAALNEFGNYLLRELNIDLSSLLGEQLPDEHYRKMMAEVDKLLDILRAGLGKRAASSSN